MTSKGHRHDGHRAPCFAETRADGAGRRLYSRARRLWHQIVVGGKRKKTLELVNTMTELAEDQLTTNPA